uniref:Uncharacterized protein n=1 Tax=Cannabis sativa TaxID=3483 RepID=A0A803PWA6_CANSA
MCALRPIALFFSAKTMELIHTPPPTNNGEKKSNATDPKQTFQNPNNGENNDTHESQSFFEDFDSACSTPYVSAPSSPGRGGGHVSGFFYSCPASPMHFVLASSNSVSSSCFNSAMDDSDTSSVPMGYEFEFSARFGSTGSVQTGSMSSADELFLNDQTKNSETQKAKKTSSQQSVKKSVIGKPTNGVGKRRVPPSPHELHYTTKRAQAEEMRKKTYLPYRQGLLGCLGFSSKGYGAMNGLARALNPVSSR